MTNLVFKFAHQLNHINLKLRKNFLILKLFGGN